MPNVAHGSPQDPLLVSVKQAAAMLSLSLNTVYEMCSRGDLESVLVTRQGRDGNLTGGRSRRVKVASIRDWVARQPTERPA